MDDTMFNMIFMQFVLHFRMITQQKIDNSSHYFLFIVQTNSHGFPSKGREAKSKMKV